MIRNTLIYIGGVFVAIYVTAHLVGGLSLSNILNVAVPMGFALMVLLIALRRHWPALLLLTMAMPYTLPVFLLDALGLGFCLQIILLGIMLVEAIVQERRESCPKTLSYRLLWIGGALIVLRLIIDHPSSARLGEAGGLNKALNYSMALPLLMGAVKMGGSISESPRFWRLAFYGLALLTVVRIIARLFTPWEVPIYFSIFEGPMWLLGPLVLSRLLQRCAQFKFPLTWPLVWSALLVLMAVMSPFRSRLYFAIAAIFVVFYLYGHRRLVLWGGPIVLAVFIGVLAVLPTDMIPISMRRAISTLKSMDPSQGALVQEKRYSLSTEMGWTTDFRAMMFQVAYENIKRHPWVGSGWRFSYEEILLASQSTKYDESGLVVAGDFHNTFLALASKCGLPTALLIVVGLIGFYGGMVRGVTSIQDSQRRMVAIGLLGVAACYWGQALMNGGADELQGLCLLGGLIYGLMAKSGNLQPLATTEAPGAQPAGTD